MFKCVIYTGYYGVPSLHNVELIDTDFVAKKELWTSKEPFSSVETILFARQEYLIRNLNPASNIILLMKYIETYWDYSVASQLFYLKWLNKLRPEILDFANELEKYLLLL
jgi:hypothetical protein